MFLAFHSLHVDFLERFSQVQTSFPDVQASSLVSMLFPSHFDPWFRGAGFVQDLALILAVDFPQVTGQAHSDQEDQPPSLEADMTLRK